MALEIWYDQAPSSDFGPGDPAIFVHSVAELDQFLDRVIQETAGYAIPSMIEVSIVGQPQALEVGIAKDRGFINALTGDGGMTVGDPARTGDVLYDNMGNTEEIPAWAEIPAEMVRQALHEFLETNGATPSGLTFRGKWR